MWRLLPLCLLAGCMFTDPKQSADSTSSVDGPRILRATELPLSSATPSLDGESSTRSFRGSWASGQVDTTGGWHIRSEVQHGRLRCGVYEVGMQLGRGNRQCTDARWVTGVDYVTRERQCNSATRIHTGGGRFSSTGNRFEEANCVRVVLRCQGNC
jgi:hypothetical protein